MKQTSLSILLVVLAVALSASPIWENSVKLRESLSVDYAGEYALGPDGSMVYVWTDLSSGTRDIYAQKYSSEGVALWGQALEITQDPGSQDNPVISRLYDNRYIVVYKDFSSNPNGDLRSKVFTENGVLYPPTSGRLIEDNDYSKQSLQIARLSDNSVLVTWSDLSWGNSEISCFKLNQSGAPVWSEPRRLTYSPAHESTYKVIALDNGKFMLGYHASGSSGHKGLIMRYSANAVPLDIVPVDLNPAVAYSYFHDLVMTPDQEPAVLYSYVSEGYHLALVLLSQIPGQNTQHVIASSDNGFIYNQAFKLQVASDSTLLTAWIEGSAETRTLKAQKINPTAGAVWQEGGIPLGTVSYYSRDLLLAADSAGGAYLSWDQNYAFDESSTFPRLGLIRLSDSGTVSQLNTDTWISNRQQTRASMFTIGDRLVLGWQGLLGENHSFQHQIYAADNTPLLNPEQRLIIGGLTGDVEFSSMMVHKNNSGAIVVWEDRRDSYGKRIYTQVVDQSGNPLLESNGVMLGDINTNLSTVVDEQGRVAVIWIDSYNPIFQAGMQLIDTDGALLWGAEGIRINLPNALTGNIHVSYDSGAYYLGWTEYVHPGTDKVHAQKIVNGELQWGENGIIIADSFDTNLHYTLKDICGRYYTMEVVDTDVLSSSYRLYVQLLNPDGTNAWTEARIPVSNHNSGAIYQLGPLTYLDDSELVISWAGMHQDYLFHIYSQKINSAGAYLWDEVSVMIGDNYQMESFYQVPTTLGPLHLLTEFPSVNAYLNSEVNGAPLWTRDPLFENPAGVSISPAAVFDNNTAILGFVNLDPALEQPGVYSYLHLAGDGPGSPNLIQFTNPGFRSRGILIDGEGEEAYALWDEFHFRKNSGNEGIVNDFVSLRLQAFAPGSVSNEDPMQPPPAVRLEQNYPNPFNPETTINYYLEAGALVSMEIFNTRGQLVRRLVNEYKHAGSHSVIWDGQDQRGESVSSGLYYYKLASGNISSTRKMILMK